jgi:hypothetical protein
MGIDVAATALPPLFSSPHATVNFQIVGLQQSIRRRYVEGAGWAIVEKSLLKPLR